MSLITRFVSRISPSLRRIHPPASSLPSSRHVLPSPLLAQDALCAFGRGFSTSANSVPFLTEAEFLANEQIKKVLADYRKDLRSDNSFGVPDRWDEAENVYKISHMKSLVEFHKLALYSPVKIISIKNYMALYLRGTLDDLGYLLYFLYQHKLKLGSSSKFIHCIVLSDLNVSPDACHILRTDASVSSSAAGYGILLSGGKEPKVEGDSCTAILSNVQPQVHVLCAELYAVYKGLELALSEDVKKVKILSDCAVLIDLIVGKKVVYETFEPVMNILCDIGKLLKQFTKYSCSHVYRQQNLEADYFAVMGRKNCRVHPEDLRLFTSYPKYRFEGTFETINPFPTIVFPTRPSGDHSYQAPAGQPVAGGGGAPT